MAVYPQDDCNGGSTLLAWAPTARLANALTTLKTIGMSDPPSPEEIAFVERTFAGGSTINVGGGHDGVRRRCVEGASFVAAPATEYEVVLTTTRDGPCEMFVRSLDLQGGQVRRVAVPARGLICKRAVQEAP